MERYKICTTKSDYVPAKPRRVVNSETQYGGNDVYTKLRSYNTPLCQPFENKTFLQDVEPSMQITRGEMCRTNNLCQDNSVYTYLNQRGVASSPYFQKNNGNGEYFNTKADSRLFDVRHNHYMQVDTPPIQVIYNLINDNVSGNPALSNYGKNYTDYASVNAGQIQYYVDKELAEPFYSPVYGIKSGAIGTTYKDPMDSSKPVFTKEYPPECKYPTGTCLSFINDTTKFRDDIISRQQRVHNQQKYELVYNKGI